MNISNEHDAVDYAAQSGTFMAIALMMKNHIRHLEGNDWHTQSLKYLSEQLDRSLEKFGYDTNGHRTRAHVSLKGDNNVI